MVSLLKQNKRFSTFSFLLACIIIIGVAMWYPKWEKPGTEATLSWDVMGYYLYLPATFIYKDLDQLAFKETILKKYNATSSFYQAHLHKESGNYVMKYPIGLSILYSPFFALGHLYALNSAFPADGFSLPYQAAISWGSLFIAFIGLWFCRKILLLYFDGLSSGLTLLLIAIGTNYLNYTAIDGAMAHNWGFTLLAILIWASIQWHKKPSYAKSLLIGVCIGLAALSRPTNVLFALVPILWGIKNMTDISEQLHFFQKHWKKLLLTIITVAAIGCIQLFYWKLLTDQWIYYSYDDQGFSWLRPHIKNVLISFRKGWLIYTPIMSLALIGFVFLYQKYRFLFWTSFSYFLLHFYIVSAWDVWAYGGAFGQRAMIECYTILALPLTAFIEHIFKNKLKTWLLLAFAAFCIWLNVFQTWQAHGHGFEVEAMTKAYYWRIFGNTNPNALDRKLLDTKEDFQGERKQVEQIYFNDFEAASTDMIVSSAQAKSGNNALHISPKTAFSKAITLSIPKNKANKWLRVKADFHLTQKEWDVWKMTQLIVQFEKGEKIIKKRMIRIQRQLSERQWLPNWTDMKIPKEDFDQVKIYFWNAGSAKEVFIDDLVVEVYEG